MIIGQNLYGFRVLTSKPLSPNTMTDIFLSDDSGLLPQDFLRRMCAEQTQRNPDELLPDDYRYLHGPLRVILPNLEKLRNNCLPRDALRGFMQKSIAADAYADNELSVAILTFRFCHFPFSFSFFSATGRRSNLQY